MNPIRFYIRELEFGASNSGSIKFTVRQLNLSIYITNVYWQINKNVVDYRKACFRFDPSCNRQSTRVIQSQGLQRIIHEVWYNEESVEDYSARYDIVARLVKIIWVFA